MTNEKFLALPLLTPLGKNLGATIERNSMERLLVYIYKFWNIDNRFLVGEGFKFLKLRCMLHILLKHFGQSLATTLLNKINIITYFENLIIELHVLYTFNIHVKFCINWILFTIWFIILYFMHNFKL